MGECVIVLGTHRSGTSCTAGVIARLGVEPAPDDIPADDANPRGYSESVSLNGILNDFGAGEPGAEGRLDEWIMSRLGPERWLVKDPRLVVCLPRFVELVWGHGESVRIVGVWRQTAEIAASLANYGHGPRRARQFAESLARQRDDALRWAMGAEIPTLLVSYPELVAYPAREVGRLAGFLGVPVTDVAVAFPTPKLRRNVLDANV